MFDTTALWLAFAGMVPLMLVVIVSDLKRMKIPNAVVLAVIVLFLVTGIWGLPLDVFAWRIAHGVIALVLGFLLFSVGGGHVGAGDLKLIAALTPFVPGAHLATVLFLFAVAAFALLIAHQVVRIATRRRETGWKAFDQAVYLPAGVALGVTMIAYMGLELASRSA